MSLKQMLVTHNEVRKSFQPVVISLMPLFDSALLLTQQHLEKISPSLQELVILIFSPKDSLVFAKALILQQKLYICKCNEEVLKSLELLFVF